MENSLKEEFLRSQFEKEKSNAFSLFDLEKFSLPHLKKAGVEEAELDARLLLQEAFSLDTKDYLLLKREPIARGESMNLGQFYDDLERNVPFSLALFFSFLEKRIERVPLSQILGRQEFFGLSFFVNENVLSPRQDTECIIERILEEEKYRKRQDDSMLCRKEKDVNGEEGRRAGIEEGDNLSVLDLCTGSGCIGLTLAKNLKCKTMLLLDKSGKALEVAKENYRRIFLEQKETIKTVVGDGFEERRKEASVYFLESNLFESLPLFMEEHGISGFDLLVSNPPYIKRDVIETLDAEVSLHEPVLALDGGKDGLDFYRRIAKEGKHFLLPGARVYVEIGYDQGARVKDIFQKEGFFYVEVFQDYEGRDRGVRGTFL